MSSTVGNYVAQITSVNLGLLVTISLQKAS